MPWVWGMVCVCGWVCGCVGGSVCGWVGGCVGVGGVWWCECGWVHVCVRACVLHFMSVRECHTLQDVHLSECQESRVTLPTPHSPMNFIEHRV